MAETAPEKQPWAHLVADMLDKLIAAPGNITWGDSGSWRRSRVAALQQLSLPDAEDSSLPPLLIEKGGMAWLDGVNPKTSTYDVSWEQDGRLYGQEVPFQSAKVVDPVSVPDYAAVPIQLMCFELFPYAALRADLISPAEFFAGLRVRSKYDDGSTSWAAFFGMDPSLTPKRPLASMASQQPSRGDVIVLHTLAGTGAHTVIASGQTGQAGPLLYSLWHTPDNHPGRWPIAEIKAGEKKEDPIVSFRVVTPRKPGT